jgi:penicillin-binding protein 1A
MNLKNQKKKNGFDIKSFLDFSRFRNKSVSPRRGRKSGISSIGDFSSRIGKLKSKKNDKNAKIKAIAKKVAVFSSVAILFIALIGVLALLGLVSAMSRDLPDADKYLEESRKGSKESIIYDRNGVELYRIRGRIVNEQATLSEFPEKLQWAFMAAEDANFRNHPGLDYYGLSRALSCAIGNYLQGKSYETCGGGSSITQQLIKVTTADNERSLERKIREAILAMSVEETYTKDEILESYLNVVGMGREYVGVKTGSIYIFGKENMNDLTLAEICYLAAFPNNPEIFSPRGAIYNPQRSQDRALYVLERMWELRDRTGITEEEYNQAKEEIKNIKYANDDVNMRAGHFTNEVLNELDRIYADRVGEGQKGRDFLATQGYRVITTLDYSTQELLENTIKTQVDSARFQDRTGAQTAAGVVMDVKTGEILALVGSKNFNGAQDDIRFSPKFNAAGAKRSMGSSIKPFVYGSTFEKGYNPSTVLSDLPIDQSPSAATRPGAEPYPRNFSPSFGAFGAEYGSTTGRGDFITMRQALRWSLNQPAVHAVNLVGTAHFADFYVRASGNESLRSEFAGVSSALGAANVPLVDHVTAYATIADNGVYKPKKYILRIEDSNGNIVFDNSPVESKQVIEKSVAYLINDMNKNYFIFDVDVDPNFNVNSRNLIAEIRRTTDWAGKTGTSDTPRGPGDITFVGYTPTTVMGMWAGNSCGSQDLACPPLKSTAESGWLYDHLFIPFLNEYKSKLPAARFQRPAGVNNVTLCNLTGNLMSEECSRAGGVPREEIVSTVSLPKPEFLIENQNVTQCGGSLKLAREIDRELGLAQVRYTIRYDKTFPQKYIADQVYRLLTTKNDALFPIVTETCNIERSTKAPEVVIANPVKGGVYSQLETINVVATVKSDLPLQKVEIVRGDGVILRTFGPNDPISYNLDLSSFSVGQNSIRVLAVNSRGAEGSDTANFTVVQGQPEVFFNNFGPSLSIRKTPDKTTHPLSVRVVGVPISEITDVQFSITSSGGYNVTFNGNRSGSDWIGTWAPLPNADPNRNYTITVTAIRTSGPPLTKQATGVRLVP